MDPFDWLLLWGGGWVIWKFIHGAYMTGYIVYLEEKYWWRQPDDRYLDEDYAD